MPKLARGSFVILLMCGVALALSIFAAWYRYQAGDAALRYWGRDAALRIRSAPKSKLIFLGEKAVEKEPAAGKDYQQINDVKYIITKTIDISDAKGLIHARNALLEDVSLDEHAAPPDEPLGWDRVVEFADVNGKTTSFAIDLETGWIIRTDNNSLLKLRPSDNPKTKDALPGLVTYLKRFTEGEK